MRSCSFTLPRIPTPPNCPCGWRKPPGSRAGRGKVSPSDRSHSQVTTEVVLPYTHPLGAVGQERLGGFASSTLPALAGLRPARLQVSAVIAGCLGAGFPGAAVIPSSVPRVYRWLQELLRDRQGWTPATARLGSAQLLPKEQRAQRASSRFCEERWGGGGRAEHRPEGCTRKPGLGSRGRCCARVVGLAGNGVRVRVQRLHGLMLGSSSSCSSRLRYKPALSWGSGLPAARHGVCRAHRPQCRLCPCLHHHRQ